LNRSVEVIKLINEDQIDNLFELMEEIIQRDYESWDKFKSDIEDVIYRYYNLSDIVYQDYQKGCRYDNGTNEIYIGIPNTKLVSKSIKIDIISDIFHELSHFNLTYDNTNHSLNNLNKLNSQYFKDYYLDDRYILNAIERPAWAITLAFELVKLRQRPEAIINISDSLRGRFKSVSEFKSIIDTSYSENLRFFIYALANNPKNDSRSVKLVRLLNKYFINVFSYLDRFKYISRGVNSVFGPPGPFM